MATSPFASSPKELLGTSFSHVRHISWRNVAFKEQVVCRRENNLLKKKKLFLQTWYIMVLPMWAHIFVTTFTTVNLLLNLNGTSCFSLWEEFLPPFGRFFLYKNMNFHM
jgi:hypothetical protein